MTFRVKKSELALLTNEVSPPVDSKSFERSQKSFLENKSFRKQMLYMIGRLHNIWDMENVETEKCLKI